MHQIACVLIFISFFRPALLIVPFSSHCCLLSFLTCFRPKNKGKGGKNRRRGKNEGESKRELNFKEEGQEYAQVLRMLGNGRLEAQCFDGQKRLCHIRGKLRKKVWVNQGDIVLVGLRDYQDAKADVILKYTADEARQLKSYGELPGNYNGRKKERKKVGMHSSIF
jgi:translation initiation factor 1A